MICRLCYNESSDLFQDLFNEDGLPNGVHGIVAKYFELNQAQTIDGDEIKCSRIICHNCWQHIDDFDKFKQKVLDAQQRHYSNFSEHAMANELLKEEYLSNHSDDVLTNDNDSNDDMPLQLRWQKELATRSKCMQNTQTATGPDLLPLTEIELNVADALDDWSQAFSSADETEQDPVEIAPVKLVAKKQRAVRPKTKRKVGRPRKEKSKSKLVQAKKKPKEKTKLQTATDVAKDNDESNTFDYNAFLAEHWKAGLPCGLCDYTAPTYMAVHAHFREAHDGVRGFVMCCGRKHFQRHELVGHVQMHLNPQIFECPQCKKCSLTQRGLRTHIKRMHTDPVLERKYECEVCHKRFTKPAILRVHMLIHAEVNEDHKCSECGKCFPVDAKLQQHLRTVHNPENISVCEQCGKFFKDRYSFKAHMLQHQGVQPRKWPCDLCDTALNTKFSLKRHKRVVHHDNSVAYICSVCGKVALTAEALRSHKRNVHERERKHVCSVCGKGFKVLLVLKEHMTIHTGQNLYNCPHCPKTFRVSANMHHHRKRVHPKEWEATRQHRVLVSTVDLSSFNKEVII